MNKFNKIVTFIFGVGLITSLLSSCSYYDTNYQIFDLWVGGVKVTTRNQSDILGDGTLSYVHEENGGTLTLNNANIEKCATHDVEACVLTWMKNLTIELVGENKVGMGELSPVNGIVAGNLTISGDGILDVGGNGSCIKGDVVTIESGKIITHMFNPNTAAAGIMGVSIWADTNLKITGGEIEVMSTAAYSPFSYGLYSTQNIDIRGGSIKIKQENAFQLGIGLISSGSINISGGNLELYGFDDAMNTKLYSQTGGHIVTSALDIFGDGACRLVEKATIMDGFLSVNILMVPSISYPCLLSKDLTLSDSLTIKGGSDVSNIEEKDKSSYIFDDVYVEIG